MFSSCPVFVTPICPRCGKGQFGIKELEVQNAAWKHYAILCTSCGCVVGTETTEHNDTLNKIAQRLGV